MFWREASVEIDVPDGLGVVVAGLLEQLLELAV
jgi:hypothetical protein